MAAGTDACSSGVVNRRPSIRRSLAAAFLPACRTSEPRTFALSRAFYEDGAIEDVFDDDPAAACAAPFVLALPIALDVLFLPVALPRDLLLHGSPGG